MNKEAIKEYYNILNMFKVSLYALKWLEQGGKGYYEAVCSQNEYLLTKLLIFCVNHVGDLEDIDETN